MPDIFRINYNGVNPRLTYEELINVVDYPVKIPARSATCARDSPWRTQLDGIGMMDLEELGRRETIKIPNADMIRQIAMDTVASAQLLRALNKKTLNAPTHQKLIDSRADVVDE